jgi:hypothetical protein
MTTRSCPYGVCPVTTGGTELPRREVPPADLQDAISSAGDVLTGDTPDALTQKIRAYWQAMQ